MEIANHNALNSKSVHCRPGSTALRNDHVCCALSYTLSPATVLWRREGGRGDDGGGGSGDSRYLEDM